MQQVLLNSVIFVDTFLKKRPVQVSGTHWHDGLRDERWQPQSSRALFTSRLRSSFHHFHGCGSCKHHLRTAKACAKEWTQRPKCNPICSIQTREKVICGSLFISYTDLKINQKLRNHFQCQMSQGWEGFSPEMAEQIPARSCHRRPSLVFSESILGLFCLIHTPAQDFTFQKSQATVH